MANSELFDLHKKYDSIKVRNKYPYSHIYTQQIYPKLLDPRRNEPLKVLEVGICYGGALQAMRDYLPNATIIGYDIEVHQLRIENYDRIKIFQGSQDDPAKLKEVSDLYGPFDVVIDDACHLFEPQLVTLNNIWPKVAPGGLYIIEDIMTLTGKRGKASSQIFHHIKNELLKFEDFAVRNYAHSDKLSITFFPTMIVLEKMK